MFTQKLDTLISNGVANICVRDTKPKGIGLVSWSCTGDDRQLQTIIFNNLL